MKEINSLQNPTVKSLVKLRDSGERKKQGLFLIEGLKELGLAIEAGVEIKNIFVSPGFAKTELDLPEDKVIKVEKKVFEKISYRENPDGYLATAKTKVLKLSDIKLSQSPLVIILESVEKPGNLGAILRTADAAGADAVVITDPKTDIYNPNTIRSSRGTIFTKPVVIADKKEIKNWCEKNKIKIYAASLEAAKVYTEANFKSGTAILLGTEDKGLTREWLDLSDERIIIPMRGKIDSLNVSVSASVILYEVLRQRN